MGQAEGRNEELLPDLPFAGAHRLGPFPAAFPGALIGIWIEIEAAGTQTWPIQDADTAG